MLVRLLYASRPAAPPTDSVVDAILQQSRKNNSRQGITGMLCFSDQFFVQVLEGGRDEVCELYNTIVRDVRHTGVRILLYDEIAERRFGSWTMGRVPPTKAYVWRNLPLDVPHVGVNGHRERHKPRGLVG